VSAKPALQGSVSSTHSYKFFVQNESGRRQVNVVPQEVAETANLRGPQVSSAITAQSLTKSSTIRVDDISTATSDGGLDGTIITAPPEALVVAAAAECGMVGDIGYANGATPQTTSPDVQTQEANHQQLPGMFPVFPPWINQTIQGSTIPITAYYIFPQIGSLYKYTCDAFLEFEEALVCTADKLAQLADTIAPLTWTPTIFPSGAPPSGYPASAIAGLSGTWTLPPPSEQDKFVVRDTAIDVLSHIPMFDAVPMFPTSGGAHQTCSELYAQYDRNPTSDLETVLFGGPPTNTYPPNPSGGSSAMTGSIVKERQAFEAANLRSAGQLLHDLVRESVYSDLAGAAANMASTGDPLAGQALASGLTPAGQYDSLAHIARTLLGRWERSSAATPDGDPKCGGVAELDLLPVLGDPGLRARQKDLGAVTSSQAGAEALFEKAGLVVADAAAIDLRGALATRLVSQKVGAGPTAITSPDVISEINAAITNLLSTLSDSDLARGAQHNRVTFSIFTNSTTDFDPSTAASSLGQAARSAGLTVSSVADAALGGAGIAIDGGLSAASATTDPLARSGPMMVASQCLETSGAAGDELDEVNALLGVPLSDSSFTFIQYPGESTRQDAFAVGSAIRSRLVKLRELADPPTGTSPSSSRDTVARAAAIAELGAWAGSGRAILHADISDSGVLIPDFPQTLYLELMGIQAGDLGAKDEPSLLNAVSLVYGDPHMAECAAKLTTVPCDPTAVAGAVWYPSSLSSYLAPGGGAKGPSPSQLRAQFGATGDWVTLSFSMTNAPAALLAQAGSGFNGFDQPFYVVSAQDPNKPTGIGEVHGALRLPIEGIPRDHIFDDAMFTLSPMRRELLNDAFGLGHWVGAAPPHAGEANSAGPPSFCIEHVPRDMFVPLQNDLTDSNDAYENSWSHYLSLAQQAATNADDLGQQLVDIGFQRTQTIENSEEELLSTTGVATDVSALSIDPNGTINAGATNGALASALQLPILDVVFFGLGPTTPADFGNAIGCASAPAAPLCTRLTNGAQAVAVPIDTIQTWPGSTPVAPGQAATDTIYYTAMQLPKTGNTSATTSSGGSAESCASVVGSMLALKGLTPVPGGGTPTYSALTAVDQASLTSAVIDLDPQQVLSGISQTTMSIDDQPTAGHWRVAYAGSTVMDSDDPTSWPGCLRGSCPFATNATMAELNDLFRWCPSGDSRTTVLGGCDSASGPAPASADAEVNAIRWRVEGALWLAAAMAGDIPAGMFSGPMPAANLASSTSSAPVNTFFANGTFTTSGPGLPATLSSTFGQPGAGESAALGTAVAVDPTSRYFHWGANGAQQIPLWLLTIYAPSIAQAQGVPFTTGDAPQSTTPGANDYVHVFGSNVDGTSDFTNLNGFFQNGLSNQLGPGMWGRLAKMLAGGQCQNPVGDGPFGATPGAGQLQGIVAALKTEQATSSDMRSRFVFQDPESWSEWGTAYEWSGSTFVPSSINGIPAPPRSGWFNQVPVRWHWYDSNFCLPSNCDEFYSSDYWHPADALGVAQRNPSSISPDERLRFALNSGSPNGDCDAAWQLTGAMALSCILGVDVPQNIPPTNQPPNTLTSVADLITLSAWMDTQLSASSRILSNAYVTGVPAAIVANAKAVPGALSSTAGSMGADLAQGANALLSVYGDWNNVQSAGQSITNAVDATRIAIALANVKANEASLQTSLQKLQALKSIALDTIQTVGGIGGIVGGVGQIVTGAVTANYGELADGISATNSAQTAAAVALTSLGFDIVSLPLINKLASDNGQELADQIDAAISNLNQQVNVSGTTLQNAMITVRQDINNITSATAALTVDQSRASYYAGKAAGADVWQCASAQGAPPVECTSSVNTVLNRRYDGTEIRYQSALTNAKAMAYTARLAIEQRLGVRMNDLTTPIGTLDAPFNWADDVCHLTGVDYKTLSQQLPDAGSSGVQQDAGSPRVQQATIDQQVASEFADQFIGDYVQKLTDFVTFYNTTYPEQDGNDTAVLSLRENLLGGKSFCQGPSPNLLVDSSRLFALVSASPMTSISGWTRNSCATTDANCLRASNLPNLAAPSVPGGATWLSDQARPAMQSGIDVVDVGAVSGGPDDVESQEVALLNPGTYVLSWWDQAIDPTTGGPLASQGTPPPPYQAGIYDSAWSPMAGFAGPPTSGPDAGGAGWSARRQITFNVTSPDVFHVVFGASVQGGPPGSVAIANVQLELAAQRGAGATSYVDTNASGSTSSFACALSPSDLLALFVHNCDPDGTCHYDLSTPIVINTQAMTANGVSIAGKLAVGNFNFRHIDVGVNVVGTGVLSCQSTGSPDCFGSGYLQYTLQHDGSNVGVLGYDGQYRMFDFGRASIEHGKAVTAERYITTPIGSDDLQLLAQVQQVQFRGRPIDGVYRLSIYDTPALQFDQIQDIQLVLNYHYWSRVTASNNAN
jgi:hypothetical protein